MSQALHNKLVAAGFLDDSVQRWGDKLLSQCAARAADCCLDDMTDEEKEESIRDMVGDFCCDNRVPSLIHGQVVNYIMGRIV